jgi:hypothetical protein
MTRARDRDAEFECDCVTVGAELMVIPVSPTKHSRQVTTAEADRRRVLHLAAVAGVDVRTAARALREGADAIRGPHRTREAIRSALQALKGDATP